MVSGIVEIPLDGVFLTGVDARIDAGQLPNATLPAGTPIDLLFSDVELEDVYRTFGGFEANVTRSLSCNTQMFLGYRYTRGRATDQTIGTAIESPLSTAIEYDINASFSDFEESRLQLGFLTNNHLRNQLDFLWGGRIGLGFVDDITGTFDIDGLSTLEDIRLYDDTTNLSFGFNFGFQRQLGRLTAHALTGLEYRTSLDSDDRDLAALGLADINTGSGFASLPIYLGFTYQR